MLQCGKDGGYPVRSSPLFSVSPADSLPSLDLGLIRVLFDEVFIVTEGRTEGRGPDWQRGTGFRCYPAANRILPARPIVPLSIKIQFSLPSPNNTTKTDIPPFSLLMMLRATSSLGRATQSLSKQLLPRHIRTTASRLVPAAARQGKWITHHNQVKEPTRTFNFIDNCFHESSTKRWIDLRDPATQTIITRVPESTTEELTAAVDAAQRAFTTWRNTSLLSRQQIMFRLAALIGENMDRLAASITLEQVHPPTVPPLGLQNQVGFS